MPGLPGRFGLAQKLTVSENAPAFWLAGSGPRESPSGKQGETAIPQTDA